KRLGIWIFRRCFRCLRSRSLRNLRSGRWRLSWVLFGGLLLLLFLRPLLNLLLLLLLFLRQLLNLFHFIFVSHSNYSLQKISPTHVTHRTSTAPGLFAV